MERRSREEEETSGSAQGKFRIMCLWECLTRSGGLLNIVLPLGDYDIVLQVDDDVLTDLVCILIHTRLQ